MEENLRQYVERLFADAPKTRKMLELREEIFMNLKEKYNDLRENGASEEEAYEIVKSSIGDVDELISSANDPYAVPGPSERSAGSARGLLRSPSCCTFLLRVYHCAWKHEPADSRPHVHVYPDRGSNGPARVPQLAASGLSV